MRRTAPQALACTFLHIFSVAAQASNADNYFINPPKAGATNDYTTNEIWEVGQIQEVSWQTDISNQYTITLWQQNLQEPSGYSLSGVFSSAKNAVGLQSFNWSVQLYTTNLTLSNVFWLWVTDSTGDNAFSSHYFNITDAPISSTASTTQALSSTSQTLSTSSTLLTTSTSSTVSTTSSSMTSSTTSSSQSSTPASAAPTSTDSTLNSKNDSLAVPVGLGVGLGVGIPLVLIAGIWIGIKAVAQRKRNSSRSHSPVQPSEQTHGSTILPPGPPTYNEKSKQQIHEAAPMSPQLYEADTGRPLQEMEGSMYR